MHVVRGSLVDVDRDRQVTRELAFRAGRTGRRAVRAWRPPRHLAFGRRDAAADGYARARQAAADRGFEPVERRVGGRAVAYTGETVAFALAVPAAGDRTRIDDRYDRASGSLRTALEGVGATVSPGEPANSFCPGDHSLQGGGKVAGLAQRVERDVAVLGGCVVVSEGDESEIATALDPVYGALGVPFDPNSVGSVAGAGGTGDPTAVVDAIERAFVGDRDAVPVDAAALLE